MGDQTEAFEHPKSWRGRILSVPILWAVVAAVQLTFVSDAERNTTVVALFFVGAFVLSITLLLVRVLASKISTSEEGITASRYLGAPRHIPWEDVAAVERSVRGRRRRKTAIRVTPRAGGSSILFTDAISNFGNLMSQIEMRVPNVRQGRMPLILRLIL